METLCALIRGDLSPAGNKVSLRETAADFDYPVVGYQNSWVDSGTSALALALLDAKAKRPEVKNPRVIIPGYCCPDLVAAAVYAGVKPLAVDIRSDDASYDLHEFKNALTPNVIAVIAINFLGIKERLAEIREILTSTQTVLIEDNAQWFPANTREQNFNSDYTLFSFGRGKPLSLLGGGLLLSKNKIDDAVLQTIRFNDAESSFKQKLKLVAYNFLLNPHLYCYLNRAPFLHLGQTYYDPLKTIAYMSELTKNLFMSNLQLHEARDKTIELTYDAMCNEKQCLKSIDSDRRGRLLRYPLLMSSANIRDKLLHQFNAAGLGSSPLYQQAIVDIAGVAHLIDVQGDLDNAREFARRFVTLPTHQYVSMQSIERMKKIINE